MATPNESINSKRKTEKSLTNAARVMCDNDDDEGFSYD
jgi:hypothetical protein